MTTTSPMNQSLEDMIASWINIELNPWLTRTLPRKEVEVNSVRGKLSALLVREIIVVGVRTSKLIWSHD